MGLLLLRRLAAPALAAAVFLSPALRLACDTVCARPETKASTHCDGAAPSETPPGDPAGTPHSPDGCRHSDEVVLSKASGTRSAATGASLPPAELVPAAALALPPAFASTSDAHRRPPPSAAAQAPAVLRL